ncbi:hypothetical protein [Paenibacillus alvei]|uniref:Uncharacterized protein n=1 Tax=Paenibacillus alvei TaxID=44250 RepID=A0AAP7A0J1_PAEAL|nr:hypothetical protein [Paenibacillus alvei]NOJ73383.1 hypothetical protein [Paenibacillus alvei]
MNNKLKEVLIGLAKASFSALPTVGGLFNEVIFDIRGRIVQKRVNDFVESLLVCLNDLGIVLEESVIKSEEFNDIYIAIIKRVVDTKSEYKLKIFQDILVSNSSISYQSDFRETFLDMVTRLDFIELEILKMFEHTGRSGSMDIEEGCDGCVSMLTSASYKERIIERIRVEFPHNSKMEIYGKYEFYICDLISKSLLIDTKTVGNTYVDLEREGLTILYITDFGKEFMKFIRSE